MIKNAPWIALLILLSACDTGRHPADEKSTTSITASEKSSEDHPKSTPCANYNENGEALFGDLHVHTSYSFDAAANSTGATPADAQRYARGETIPFFPINEQGVPVGEVRIDRPLDFLAVTDHGEFLGERALCRTDNSPKRDTTFCQNYRANERQGMMMLGTVISSETPVRIKEICGEDGALCRDYARTPWQNIQNAANNANEPCEFTSFVAYEYTGTHGT